MRSPAPESRPADGAVLALDNIALELPVAGLGSRVLASALDYLVLSVVGTVLLMALGAAAAVVFRESRWMVAVVLVVLLFAFHWGYFAGFEIGARGRTPGKMAVGLRVVGREGGTPSVAALLVRSVLRDVDLLVGVPLMATDRLSRRLGDRLAGTLVVHDRAHEAEVTLGRIPPGWGAREVAVAEAYLRRSAEMSPGRQRLLARRLLALVRQTAPDYLEEVAGCSDPDLAVRRVLRILER
jgi:uncharacterized RDD family membrane protein YckC